jgi:hypothetical protein
MKYQVEMTEGETIALLGFVESCLRMALTRSSPTTHFIPPVDVSAPEVDNEPGATITPFPTEVPEAADREVLRLKVLHGRDVWLALIEMWRENFGVEDAPQPDRAAILVRLLHMDGIAIFAFLRTKEGITDATRDVLCELYRRPLDNEIKRESRLLAENIAQVCSFYVPTLAAMLEYTAEFHIIPE